MLLPELRGLKISKLSNCTSAIKSWKILEFSGTWTHFYATRQRNTTRHTVLCNSNHITTISEKFKHRKQTNFIALDAET